MHIVLFYFILVLFLICLEGHEFISIHCHDCHPRKIKLIVIIITDLTKVIAQGNVFNPGKYRLAGSLNVLPNGDIDLRLNAKKQSAGPTFQPPTFTPTASTNGFTTGNPSGGTIGTGIGPTISTSTGPTTGYSTPTKEGGRMAGTD